MLKAAVFLGAVIICTAAVTNAQAADPYAPLRLYNGKWQVKPDKAAKPDALENNCARTGKFFVCEQTVNGKLGGLVTFLPTGEPGHYYTNPLGPDDRANGRGDLSIAGDHWEYSSKDEEAGKTTWWRTRNEFSNGGNTIRFTVQNSNDGKTWETIASGMETRVK
jgi:hypothetical protein